MNLTNSNRRFGLIVGLTVRNKVLLQALALVKSSLLQGQALLALLNFFATLVYSANTSFDAPLESFLSTTKSSPQSGGIAKQALFSTAQCGVVLCLAAVTTNIRQMGKCHVYTICGLRGVISVPD
ncbi:cullin-associated NEDD8-dissociated protein 1 [Tanacetum coccineum]